MQNWYDGCLFLHGAALVVIVTKHIFTPNSSFMDVFSGTPPHHCDVPGVPNSSLFNMLPVSIKSRDTNTQAVNQYWCEGRLVPGRRQETLILSAFIFWFRRKSYFQKLLDSVHHIRQSCDMKRLLNLALASERWNVYIPNLHVKHQWCHTSCWKVCAVESFFSHSWKWERIEKRPAAFNLKFQREIEHFKVKAKFLLLVMFS